ncbi:MAG: ATP-binding protein [Campylobacterota bacterium]|nr:ATP-binding protein [Campylobacterota bacterium]
MILELKNIGMIKEAKVNIDGLTVIAGENDTGKSTVGKALFFINTFQNRKQEIEARVYKNFTEQFNKNFRQQFNQQYSKNYSNELLSEDDIIEKQIDKEESYVEYYADYYQDSFQDAIENNHEELQEASIEQQIEEYQELQEKIFHFHLLPTSKVSIQDKLESKAIFIDTPILANFFDFFSMLATAQNEIEYEINNYPYLSKSLYKQLRLQLKKETTLDKYAQINILKEIIGGELKTNSMGDLVFVKNDGSTYPVNAVATGIKNFGILQLLLKNNYLTKDAILIIDEPEVHLHPKWQLKYAQFVVNLVQNGVKVFINSHSPYMIEALKRYSDRANLQDKTNFYLAEGGYIENRNKLQEIYEKLSEPYDEFDRMDSDILNGK